MCHNIVPINVEIKRILFFFLGDRKKYSRDNMKNVIDMSMREKRYIKGIFARKLGSIFVNFDRIIIENIKLKNMMAWAIEKINVSSKSFPFPFIKPSGGLPNIMRNAGLMTENNFMVNKKRDITPKGPESLLDMEMIFSSFKTLFIIIELYGSGTIF